MITQVETSPFFKKIITDCFPSDHFLTVGAGFTQPETPYDERLLVSLENSIRKKDSELACNLLRNYFIRCFGEGATFILLQYLERQLLIGEAPPDCSPFLSKIENAVAPEQFIGLQTYPPAVLNEILAAIVQKNNEKTVVLDLYAGLGGFAQTLAMRENGLYQHETNLFSFHPAIDTAERKQAMLEVAEKQLSSFDPHLPSDTKQTAFQYFLNSLLPESFFTHHNFYPKEQIADLILDSQYFLAALSKFITTSDEEALAHHLFSQIYHTLKIDGLLVSREELSGSQKSSHFPFLKKFLSLYPLHLQNIIVPEQNQVFHLIKRRQ